MNRISCGIRSALVGLVAGLGVLTAAAEQPAIKLATTTSTENSGLLAELFPKFEKKTGIKIHVVAVGTGKALKLGENGDVDVVLVHARAAEDKFMAAGFGTNRHDVMYNDFVLVGSANDPAGVSAAKSVRDAFASIAKAPSPFASRGDDSGTHQKEKECWTAAGIKPVGAWYMETGQGMGQTLQVADEKRAYCLTDRATFVAFQDKVGLKICFEKDPGLLNPYGIIAVNPARHPQTKYADVMKLIDWITSPEGQQAIADFKVKGQTVFFPSAAAGK